MRDADDEMPENHSTVSSDMRSLGSHAARRMWVTQLLTTFLQFKRFGITLGHLKIVVCQVIKLINSLLPTVYGTVHCILQLERRFDLTGMALYGNL